jgi:hypothetical protein
LSVGGGGGRLFYFLKKHFFSFQVTHSMTLDRPPPHMGMSSELYYLHLRFSDKKESDVGANVVRVFLINERCLKCYYIDRDLNIPFSLVHILF